MSSTLIKSIGKILFLWIIFIKSINGQSNELLEKDYANYIQSLIGGQREVAVQNGRVDLLTLDFAFEVEWASNWKESIGQSIWYALQTNKKAGIILIMKSKDDYKYYVQLNSALEYANLTNKVKVYLFPLDFQKLIDEKK